MNTTIEQKDDTLVYTLEGELGAAEVRDVRGELDTRIESDLSVHAIDISGITFIDSSGIGALVYLYKRLLERKKKMVIVGATGQPADMIRFLRIDKVIPTRDHL